MSNRCSPYWRDGRHFPTRREYADAMDEFAEEFARRQGNLFGAAA